MSIPNTPIWAITYGASWYLAFWIIMHPCKNLGTWILHGCMIIQNARYHDAP